jgi:hypothetical protein
LRNVVDSGRILAGLVLGCIDGRCLAAPTTREVARVSVGTGDAEEGRASTCETKRRRSKGCLGALDELAVKRHLLVGAWPVGGFSSEVCIRGLV